ncbi:hypothetical protein D3C80_1320360 [compost metagenome]
MFREFSLILTIEAPRPKSPTFITLPRLPSRFEVVTSIVADVPRPSVTRPPAASTSSIKERPNAVKVVPVIVVAVLKYGRMLVVADTPENAVRFW